MVEGDRCENGEGKIYFCGKKAVDADCKRCPFYLDDSHWDKLKKHLIAWLETANGH